MGLLGLVERLVGRGVAFIVGLEDSTPYIMKDDVVK